MGYTGLDVLAGIGAGAVQSAGPGHVNRVLFAQGNDLDSVGVWSYLAAALLAVGPAVRQARVVALPGAALVLAGAYSFLTSHIYWPRGVLTMLELGIGWSLLVWPLTSTAGLGPSTPFPAQTRPS